MIRIARHEGTALYMVHVTAKEGVQAVAEARGDGFPVYGEALHHYLHLTGDDYRKPEGTTIHRGRSCPGATRTSSCSTPSSGKMIALEELHADSDGNIWDGFACAGYPVMTVLRGKVVVERGKLFGSLSDGRWLPRRVDSRVLSAPAV